jgi:hypothetical protein
MRMCLLPFHLFNTFTQKGLLGKPSPSPPMTRHTPIRPISQLKGESAAEEYLEGEKEQHGIYAIDEFYIRLRSYLEGKRNGTYADLGEYLGIWSHSIEKRGFMRSGAFCSASSEVHKYHSPFHMTKRALGKAGLPSPTVFPPIWSAWPCVGMTVSMSLGEIPSASRF